MHGVHNIRIIGIIGDKNLVKSRSYISQKKYFLIFKPGSITKWLRKKLFSYESKTVYVIDKKR